MKIGNAKFSGPNLQWYLVTILVICFWGWKGMLMWLAINLFFIGFAVLTDKSLREYIFSRKLGR